MTSLKDLFDESLAGEPPLAIDIRSIERRGSRTLRRHRMLGVGGAVMGVATLTVGAALAGPRFAQIGAAGAPAPVPGCTTVLRTTDPAMLAWMHQGDPSAGSEAPGAAGVPAAPLPTTAAVEDTTPALAPSTAAMGTPSSVATGAAATAGTAAPPTVDVPAWFTAQRAHTMAAAILAALPKGVTFSADAARDDTFFDPARGPAGTGILSGPAGTASFTIFAQRFDKPAPPCTETVSRRFSYADGTITDVTAGEAEGHHYLHADSFRPDGTLVTADVDADGAAVPLTEYQLAAIVSLPELAISAAGR